MRPVIYLAGPFRADTPYRIEKNIRTAEDTSLDLWQMGYAVICPHTNTRHFHGSIHDDAIMDGHLEMLRKCDVVYILPNYETSQGTMRELSEAIECDIPALFDSRAALEWILNWRACRSVGVGRHVQLEPEGSVAVIEHASRDSFHYTFVDPPMEKLADYEIAGGITRYDHNWWRPVVEVDVEIGPDEVGESS